MCVSRTCELDESIRASSNADSRTCNHQSTVINGNNNHKISSSAMTRRDQMGLASLCLALSLQCTLVMASQQQQHPELVNALANSGLAMQLLPLEPERQIISSSQAHSMHHNMPGHYEFEVAPELKAPTVRDPPYEPSTHHCAGSDIFAGFSPRDTLCGDLNEGRVPVNPLGQMIADQPYPFELIRNKTMQFLARALPVLKLEYESIPKVARYRPASPGGPQIEHHLLNPTLYSSALTGDQIRRLNELPQNYLFDLGPASYLQDDDSMAPGPSNKRRRKRAAPAPEDSDSVAVPMRRLGKPYDQRQRDLTVAELSSNVSFTVSSAHSPTGTRFGPRSIERASPSSARLVASSQHQPTAQPKPAAPEAAIQTRAAISVSGRQDPEQPAKATPAAVAAPSEQSRTSGAKAAHPQPQAQPQPPREQPPQPQPQHQEQPQPQQQPQQVHKPKSIERRKSSSCSDSSNGLTMAICHAANMIVEGSKQPSWVQLIRNLVNADSPVAIDALQGIEAKSSKPASQSGSQATGGGLASQLLGPLSSLFGGSQTSSTDQSKETGLTSTTNGPQSALSSTITKLALAGWASNVITGLVEYLVPNMIQSVTSRSGLISRRRKVSEMGDMLVDTPASLAMAASNGQPVRIMQASAPAPPAAMSPLTGPSNTPPLGKQPPTPCPSLEEYISPTFARNYEGTWKYVVQIPHDNYFTQTIQRTSCARQKCEFTEGVCHESPRWVSLLVAEIYYPNAVFSQTSPQQQQPAMTAHQGASGAHPAQLLPASSDQLAVQVSPNSAQQHRQQQQQNNIMLMSQGQLAQFNQMNADTASKQAADQLQMQLDSINAYNQKQLDSIYIKNGLAWDHQQQQQQQQHHQHQQQQQPMMQQQQATTQANTNNPYNYQLLQRNGQLAPSTGPEARSSLSSPSATTTSDSQQQQLGWTPSDPFLAQASQMHTNLMEPSVSNRDYIIALAAAALQQNPNMNINELISTLQSQNQLKRRKKRQAHQTSPSSGHQYPQIMSSGQQPQQSKLMPTFAQPAQHARPMNYHQQHQTLESVASPNELSFNTYSQPLSSFPLDSPDMSASSMSTQIESQPQQAMHSPTTSQHRSQHHPQQQQQHQQSQASQSVDNQQQVSPSQTQPASSASNNNNNQQQQDCDGYDKIGCYIVRVHYDWFLVNGSCKCWKTNIPGQSNGSSQSGSSSTANNFLRRIFTG